MNQAVDNCEGHKIGMILWKELTIRENLKTHGRALPEHAVANDASQNLSRLQLNFNDGGR